MATYQNDSTTDTVAVRNDKGTLQQVKPGETVQTHVDLTSDTRFSVSSASPAYWLSITAENNFTDPLMVNDENRKLNISVTGVDDSTVTVQRRQYGTTTWYDVEQYTEDTEKVADDGVIDTEYRVGIKTGDYGTDTVVVKIWR